MVEATLMPLIKKSSCHRISVIDSHTAGEPTRIIVSGGPDLGSGSVSAQLTQFREHHDHYRSVLVNEPHGSDVIVGAFLTKPADKNCTAGIMFFNNVGYLGMCGHGTMGLMVTLAHMGRIKPGLHRLETPVGVVTADLHDDKTVTIANVPGYVVHLDLLIDVPVVGRVKGDVAWGGNWFFLTETSDIPLNVSHLSELTDYAWQLRQAVNQQGYPNVDHIELLGPGQQGGDARNFVLCPGKAYDRSPCGTGTSAKLACLSARGQLNENQCWVQESIIGSTFQAHYKKLGKDRILPFVTGKAYVNAETTLLIDEDDPYCWGIRR